jgi:hypothetical protein
MFVKSFNLVCIEHLSFDKQKQLDCLDIKRLRSFPLNIQSFDKIMDFY